MTKRTLFASFLVALGGCHRSALPPEPTSAEAPAPPPPHPVRTYRVVPVSHGGTVRGRVLFEGDRPSLAPIAVPDSATPAICGATQTPPVLEIGGEQGVRNAVLSLTGITAGKAPDATPVVVDQHGCQFSPHVVAGMVDTPLRFTSTDPTVLHVVRAYHGYLSGDAWFTRATPHGVTFNTTFDQVGLATFYCDSGHTWMLGFAQTFDHPYFSVSDATGTFTIDQVPPGTYALGAWHEGIGPLRVRDGRTTFGPAMAAETSVTVAPDATVTVTWLLTSTGLRVAPSTGTP